jgi:hypothetical protein
MRNLHSFLNIGQNLEHYKIVEVINFVQKEHGTNPLQDVTVVTYIILLRQLCEAGERENISKELIADIKVPDRNGRQCVTKKQNRVSRQLILVCSVTDGVL